MAAPVGLNNMPVRVTSVHKASSTRRGADLVRSPEGAPQVCDGPPIEVADERFSMTTIDLETTEQPEQGNRHDQGRAQSPTPFTIRQFDMLEHRPASVPHAIACPTWP